VNDYEFSEERLEGLIQMSEPGADTFSASYRRVSAVVYEILRETAKPGYKGNVKDALHRIGIAESTAWDMRMRHRVQIGEIPDPDIPDPRDEEEGRAQQEVELKRAADEMTTPLLCEPMVSEEPTSQPTPNPINRRRRLLADFDIDDLP